ncbi:TPA: hypothetical protein ACNZ7E_004970, partial [Klebsiella quasipneumoniae subsp. similipneumoniae]
QWLTDNSSAYTAYETRRFAEELNLEPCTTKPGNGANLLMEGQDQGDLRHDVIRALFPNHYTGI